MDRGDRTRAKKTSKSSKKSINIPSGTSNNQEGDVLIEDENTWECSVCTYRNSQEAFKCLMCDVRKGTSTRKPRYNHDLVAQQVKKQQIQIHQKLLKASSKPGQDKETNEQNSKQEKVDSKESKDTRGSKEPKEEVSETKETRTSKELKNRESKESTNSKDDSRETRTKNKKDSKKDDRSIEGNDKPGPSDDQSSSNSDTNPTNNHNHQSTLKNSVKSRETNGNSTSSLEATKKMKNIDRNNYLAQAVTVNNVTVIITEFQPEKKVKSVKKHKISAHKVIGGMKQN